MEIFTVYIVYPRLFLATLVALHLTPVSESVSGQSFGLQPSSFKLGACELVS